VDNIPKQEKGTALECGRREDSGCEGSLYAMTANPLLAGDPTVSEVIAAHKQKTTGAALAVRLPMQELIVPTLRVGTQPVTRCATEAYAEYPVRNFNAKHVSYHILPVPRSNESGGEVGQKNQIDHSLKD